jgi:hypothetical protein
MSKYYVRFVHFAPDNKSQKTPENPNPQDKSLVWAMLYDEESQSEYGSLACGYIPNRLNLEEIDKEQHYSVNMITSYYMEHLNGGRTNNRQYARIEDYWNDPCVKDKVQAKYREGMEFCFAYIGDPDRLDVIYEFTIKATFGHQYKLTGHLYDDATPPESWYNEVHAKLITELNGLEVFESASEAIQGQSKADDLFGERYFPVAKAPVWQYKQLIEACHAFKGCSNPLYDDKFVYIGIRSKQDELCEINEIYSIEGGAILKNREWNW